VAHACNPTQEAEVRRITVQNQPRQIVPGDPILKEKEKKKKNPSQK
jgi:hypothetical protein